MTQKYAAKLTELRGLIKDQISIIESGGKLSSFRREVKQSENNLREDLKELIREVARNGHVNNEYWIDVRNYFIVYIKDLLDRYYTNYPDSKSFEDEKEVILQYLAFFDKPIFTLQRIAELAIEPEKYYKSTRKILYAFEKLVNVSNPQDR